MTTRTADPARTHAVLVGIEKYEAGGDWNRLSGPVRDVLAFHEWLLSRNVPADQIMTLVSPLDKNIPLVEQSKITTSPATSTEVLRALNTLQPKRGDLLFIFWAGHGVVHEDEHRLFLADATTNHKRNLDLETLQKSLRSSYFPGFPLQIIIVDACANHQSFAFTFPSESVPCGNPLGHEQFVFFAARPGQVAKNLGEEKRGLFSQEFLRKVQELPDERWPPDMRSVAESVQATFAALRATSNLAQTPIYQWSRDWDGNAVKLGGFPTADQPGRPQRETWELTFSQLGGLTNALSGCTKMTLPDGRNDVLAQIRSDIAGSVPRRSDTKSDVMNIIRTATNYPGGLEELLWHVRYYEGRSTPWRGVEKYIATRIPNLKIPSEEAPEAAGE
jgi:hypothetical protein